MELTAETPPPRMTYLKVFAIEVKKSLRFASSQFFFCVSRVTLDDGVFGFVGYCDWPDPFYWGFFFLFGFWSLEVILGNAQCERNRSDVATSFTVSNSELRCCHHDRTRRVSWPLSKSFISLPKLPFIDADMS